MKRPNFFILGAPKCGTTSLANWLAEHPQVFMSPFKEPHFFNFDYGERIYHTLSCYEKLFANAGAGHKAVGEASTRYLYSRTAVPAIMAYSEHPRFIAMIRNPVHMVQSLHGQRLFNGYEIEADFELAWDLQEVRRYGDRIPRTCPDPQLLLYGEVCKLGAQIRRLLDSVASDQVLIVNLDHLKANTRAEYLRVLDFLRLDDDQRDIFPVANPAKRRRFPGVWSAVKWGNWALRAAGVPRIRTGVTDFVDRRDRKIARKSPMNPEFEVRLRQFFHEDVNLLEELSGWDLTAWK